ncbi:MAG: hypothetical protein WAO91_10350 [Candidatus Nitrosotenuis sp.]
MQKLVIAFCLVTAFLLPNLASADSEIPNWIKGKIKLWAFDKITDEDFLNALIDLDERGLLSVQELTTVGDSYVLPEYGKTDFVKITGRMGEYGQTSPVFLIVIDPDGSRNEYTVPVLQSGAYSTVIPLSFSSPVGTYKVLAYRGGEEISESSFYVKRSPAIPSWIKNSAKWFADGKISSDDFVFGIQYLIDRQIITFEGVDARKVSADLNVSVDGLKAVRRGTTQNIGVHVSNLGGDIEGATVFVRVEDYGENILEEFEGVTDSDGNYNISWELSRDFDDIETFLVFVDVTDGIDSETKVFSFQVYCLCGEPNCRCRN